MTTQNDGRADALRRELLQRRLLKASQERQVSGQQVIERADRSAPLPLSWSQQRLWFIDQLDPAASAAYHLASAARLSGTLDRDALQTALDRIIFRHESLRSRFVTLGDAPVQVIDAPETGFTLVDHDLSCDDVKGREQRVADIAAAEASAHFDLSNGPLVRGRLLRLAEHEHVLLVTQHHIVSDGWSMGVFTHELQAQYIAAVEGNGDPLSPLPLQYADYATWQRSWLKHDALAHQVDFWRNHLADAPALIGLPTDRPRPAVQSFRGETVAVHIPAALTNALKQLSQRHGTTLFMTLLAGWATLLSRWSGQSDLVIGTPVANRSRPELEPMIGFFVNTLAMRIRLDDDLSVAALLAQIRATTLAAYGHQDVPFDQVVEAVKPARSLSHGPLFQVMLSLDNTAGGEPRALGDLVLEPLQIDQVTAHFDLSLALAERAGEICGVAQFASDLFDADSVKRHVAAFSIVLSAMVADDSQPIIGLPVMSERERKQLLVDFNPPAQHVAPAPLLHREFEDQVERSPGAIAVMFENTSLTYAELDCRANQLAHALRAHGAGPDLRVALCVERSVDMIVGVLGILKAGAAYVPLDPAYPDAHLSYLLQDSNPLALVTQPLLHERLATLAPSLPVMDIRDVLLRNLSTQPPIVPGLEAHHLAYVIYTSGSTGRPKGVMVEHGNIVHLWLGLRSDVFGAMEATLRVALNASCSFDASMQMIVQLLSGHCLILVPDVLRSNGDAMVRFLAQHRVDALDCTPAQLELMFDAGLCSGSTYAPVAVLVGGDAIPDVLWKRMAAAKATRFFNVYGPTECTVDATLACVDQAGMQPHIGRPLANTRIYVLDGRGQPVPIGTVGEIHIGGTQVARGYLDRPDLTRERFAVDPFIDTPSARLYRTGDLARWRADGTLQYLGRNDSQVKIRGFRIEPGEIESQLVSCDGVAEAVVIAREDFPGDRRLVAYVRAEAHQKIVAADLRDRLLSHLAPHMVPSAFVQIEAWPLTRNGKLDRSALPAPNAASIALRAYQAPDGQAEHAVAATWKAVLGVEGIGRQDNFFELGGHSLLVVAVIERLRQQGLHAEVRSLFTAPTLAGFAATLGTGSLALDAPDYTLDAQGRITPQHLPLVALEQEQIDALVGTIRGGAPSIQDIYPLGPLQQGVLFHSLLDSEGDTYLMRTIVQFDDAQRLHSFLTALGQVIARHDILRSSMHWEGLPTPVQVVHRQARMPVEVLHLAKGDAETQLRDLIDPRRMRLDLGQAPLVRAFTATDPHGDGHWLVLLSHHIVCDHVTLELLMQEVQTLLYAPSTPLPIVVPYRNFIASTLASSESTHEPYFRAQLADVLEPTAPFGVFDVRGNGRELTEFTVALSDSLSQKLRHHTRLLGVTPAALFHLAWGLVLARCCGRDDVVFGTVLSGRLQGVEGADQLLGMFINTLPVRIQLRGRGVRAAVMETHVRLSELLDHEQASLTLAQRCSGVSAELPLFTSLLNYRHNAVATDATWPGVHFVRGEERTNFPLVMSINDSGQTFSMTAQAVVGLDPHRLSDWLAHGLAALAHALEQQHDLPVLELQLATAEESRQRQQALLATTR
ncbi:non-ribosomal peptide synthetase, partial [Stenotrophomonas sp. yr243]|uniref:non-ribosomal peptide synthetase n=1 Tax=Stenotrophomonas sp. yr243 TaxID=1761902 RepID=UPI00240360DE